MIFFSVSLGTSPLNTLDIPRPKTVEEQDSLVFLWDSETKEIRQLNEDDIAKALRNTAMQHLIMISPEVFVAPTMKIIRDHCGNDFFYTKPAANMIISTPSTTPYVKQHSTWPDLALILDNDSAIQGIAIFAVIWMFDNNHVFLSISCFVERVQVFHEVTLTRHAALASDIRSRTEQIIQHAKKLNNQQETPTKLTVNIITFVEEEETNQQQLIDNFNENPIADSTMFDIVHFADQHEDINHWSPVYQRARYTFGVPEQYAWTAIAAAAGIIMLVNAMPAIENWRSIQRQEAENKTLTADIDSARQNIGNLAKNNIGGYAELYSILPSQIADFGEIIAHPETIFSASVSGKKWTAITSITGEPTRLLAIREDLKKQIAEKAGCRQQFKLDNNLRQADIDITCNFDR